jgi:hypothetical protein
MCHVYSPDFNYVIILVLPTIDVMCHNNVLDIIPVNCELVASSLPLYCLLHGTCQNFHELTRQSDQELYPVLSICYWEANYRLHQIHLIG